MTISNNVPSDSNYYYEDQNRNIIKKDLLSKDAENISDNIIKSGSINKSHLRLFLNHFKNIERHLDIDIGGENENAQDFFKRYLPLIKLVKAQAKYYETHKINKAFSKFITFHIDHIDHYKDFKAFIKLFEAVFGYSILTIIENEKKGKKGQSDDEN